MCAARVYGRLRAGSARGGGRAARVHVWVLARRLQSGAWLCGRCVSKPPWTEVPPPSAGAVSAGGCRRAREQQPEPRNSRVDCDVMKSSAMAERQPTTAKAVIRRGPRERPHASGAVRSPTRRGAVRRRAAAAARSSAAGDAGCRVDDGDERGDEGAGRRVVNGVAGARELAHGRRGQPRRHVVDAARALPGADGPLAPRHPQVHRKRRSVAGGGDAVPGRGAVVGGQDPAARKALGGGVDVGPPLAVRKGPHAAAAPGVDAGRIAVVPCRTGSVSVGVICTCL